MASSISRDNSAGRGCSRAATNSAAPARAQRQISEAQDAVVEGKSSKIVADTACLVQFALSDRCFQFLQRIQRVARNRVHQLNERFVSDQSTQLRQSCFVQDRAFVTLVSIWLFRCQFCYRGQKLGRIERLAQHFIHTTGEAGHSMLPEHICRDGNDRHVAARAR